MASSVHDARNPSPGPPMQDDPISGPTAQTPANPPRRVPRPGRLPPAGALARRPHLDAGQGELHADDEAVAPPGPPVMQGAVRGRAAEGLDAAGHGHQQARAPPTANATRSPGGGVGLAPPNQTKPTNPRLRAVIPRSRRD